jgi:hypothetical protein
MRYCSEIMKCLVAVATSCHVLTSFHECKLCDRPRTNDCLLFLTRSCLPWNRIACNKKDYFIYISSIPLSSWEKYLGKIYPYVTSVNFKHIQRSPILHMQYIPGAISQFDSRPY